MWVVETRKPERDRSAAFCQPIAELELPINKALDPASKGWCQPRYLGASLELPFSWDSSVENFVDGINKLGSHRHSTINGCNHIAHGLAHNVEHDLELLNFLSEEDTKRDILVRV